MQFSKIVISTAFIAAAFSSAAPVASSQQEAQEVVDKRAPLNPAVLLGGAGLLTSFLGSKEGQEFAASKEGQEFLSKAASIQARDVDDESAEKRLNPAFLVGSLGGSALSSIFGSKEAADDFIDKLQASQGSNSTSGIEARGSKTDIGGLVAAGLNLLHTLGARDVDEESAEKRLNPLVLAGGAGLLTSFLGSKEGQEFAASKEGQEFLSKAASIQARDFEDEAAEKRLNPAFLAGSVGGSVLSSIFGSKEAADDFINKLQASQNSNSTSGVQARGSKTDIGGLVAAGLNLLHTLGARGVDEESAEKRLNPLVLAGGAGLLTSFLGSKEGQEFAASKEGQEFLSKAASIQSRDVEERAGKFTAGGAGAGLNIVNAILNLLPSQGTQKRDINVDGNLDLLGLLHPSVKVDA